MGASKVLYDMSKKKVVAMSIKNTQCLYLERFEHFHPPRYYCRLKGLWIKPSDCDKCNVGVLKSGDGKIIVGQKRLIDFLNPKSNYNISKRPLGENGLSEPK